MNPTKSRKSNSRRSSILKPPKPRQPLQTVNLNSSSNESSPATSKLKRRVSFAEKKHVKEFCNSVEQGTVWDNTYEENEPSIGKLSGAANLDSFSIETALKENNITNKVYNPDISIDACDNDNDENSNPKENSAQNFTPHIVLGEFGNKLACTLNVANPIENVALVNEQKTFFNSNESCAKSIIPYEDTNEIEMQDCISTSMSTFSSLPSHNIVTSRNEKLTAYDKTKYYHEASLEFTVNMMSMKKDVPKTVLPNFLHSDDNSEIYIKMMDSKNRESHTSGTRGIHDIELTVPISDSLEPIMDNDRTRIFQDVSMDITNIADNLNNSINIDEASRITVDKTTIFHNISMEITKPVKTASSIHKGKAMHQDDKSTSCDTSIKVPNKINFIPIGDKAMCLNEQTNLLTTSMEITKPVEAALLIDEGKDIYREDRTKLFNTTVELTNAINPIPCKDKTMCLNEQSDLLNISMDITKPVEGGLTKDIDKAVYQEDRTKLFDTTVELTDAINPIPFKNKTLCLNKQPNLLNTPMEFTKPVEGALLPDKGKVIYQEDRTKLFDTTVELTNAINPIPFNDKIMCLNEQTNLLNTSMEITKPVNADLSTDKGKAICQEDRTKLFDTTVELTNAIKSIPLKERIVCVNEQTKSLDASMEIVEAIHTYPYPIEMIDASIHSSSKCTGKNILMENENSVYNKTRLCVSKSVELAAAVQPLSEKFISQFNDEDSNTNEYYNKITNNRLSNTKILPNNSMTITAAVSSVIVNGKTKDMNDNSKVFQDSMEITGVASSFVPPSPAIINASTLPADKQMLTHISSVNEHCLSNAYRASIVPDNVMLSKDVSMKIITAVSSLTDASNTQDVHSQNSCTSIAEIEYLNSTPTVSSSPLHGINVEKGTAVENLFVCNAKHTPPRTLNALDTTFAIKTVAEQSIAVTSIPECTSHLPLANKTCANPNTDNDKTLHSTLKYPYNSEKEEVDHEEYLTTNKLTFLEQSLDALETIEPPSFVSINESGHHHSNSLHEIVYNQKLESQNNKNQSQEVIVIECSSNSKKDQELSVKKSRKTRASETIIIKKKDETLHSKDYNTVDAGALKLYDMHNLQLISTNDVSREGNIFECSSSSMADVCTNMSMNHKKTFCLQRTAIKDSSKRRYSDQESENVSVDEDEPREKDMEIEEMLYNKDMMEEIIYNSNISKNQETGQLWINQDPFTSLISRLKTYSESGDIIWNVDDENTSTMVVAIGFIRNSLLALIFLRQDKDYGDILLIEEIKIVSHLDDDKNILMNVVHRLILDKINVKKLNYMYKTEDEILPLLDNITQEVKLAMDFMFDLKRLDDSNIMEITQDSISFISRTSRMDIVLRITMKLKSFDQIEPSDITVHCVLGTIREKDVKNLIINIRKDHKFLHRYMNDVRDYIYLMEDSAMKKLY